MSVLEICQLQVKPNISPSDPCILESLIEVRSTLASRVTKTDSRFYQCVDDPSLIYILGRWPSLASHHAFLASPYKSEILMPQQHLLDFISLTHVELDSMSSLPLDAAVMSITRFCFTGEENHVEFQRVMDKTRQTVVIGAKPHRVVDGWRCDAEPGAREALVFTGWANVGAYKDFTAKALLDPEYASMRTLCDGIEVRHMKNMEG